MTDLEISKALALAIGHHRFDVRIHALTGNVVVIDKTYDTYKWKVFDYRDWNVISPIAEKYDAFPYQTHNGTWTVGWTTGPAYVTPQKAIALAVIQGAKK